MMTCFQVAKMGSYGCGTGRSLLTLSLASSSSFLPKLLRPGLAFRPLCSAATATPAEAIEPLKHSILLDRLRIRHLKQSPVALPVKEQKNEGGRVASTDRVSVPKKKVRVAEGFEELGLSEEVMAALAEMGISVPTEIQTVGIPAVLAETRSLVLGSHTGSGKTLAYLLPLVQLLRRDETLYGMLMKPRRPRAVVLCPTRELSEQVFRVAKSISHHARFRATMVSGGTRLRPQEDSLNAPVDMVVGTPGRVLQHIEEGNIVYGDIKYVVLDEADTMFDRGFGPDIRKFLGPLKNRAAKAEDKGFQTVLVSATMTKAVQTLVDEEFLGIVHLRTSTLHKKIASARHDFIKLSGAENKLEALLQVLEPSLAKGNRVMVFCNTLNSSRAVDHFLGENQISTVNYHGEVPAEQRVENLQKFKSDDGDCPTLVCTDLAARGLDLDVDHVIMFDFPTTSIDYLHRTGRTARMGAKGKVTSLIARKDQTLATRIEEAIAKNESLESLSADSVKRDIARSRITEQKNYKAVKDTNLRNKSKPITVKPATTRGKFSSAKSAPSTKSGKSYKISKSPVRTVTKASKPFRSSSSTVTKSSKPFRSSSSTVTKASKPFKSSGARDSKSTFSSGNKTGGSKKSVTKSNTSKLNVVGFRGRSSLPKRSYGAS